jgi:hypothetical protein
MASYAATPTGTGSSALMRDGAFASLNTVQGKYANNETVSGLIAGTYIDDAKTRLNTGAQLEYNNAMQESTFKYNDALRNADVGRASQLMSAEAGLTQDLMKSKSDYSVRDAQESGNQQRLGLQETGKQNRLGQDNATDNTIELRNDARNAVSRSFKSLYG